MNLGGFKREVEYLSPDEPIDPAVSQDEPVIEYVAEDLLHGERTTAAELAQADVADQMVEHVNAKLKVAARSFRNKAVNKA